MFLFLYKSLSRSLSWSWTRSRSQSRHISGPGLGPGPILFLVPAMVLVLVTICDPVTQWVEASDDKPVRGLLPGQGRATGTTILGPIWVMLGGNEGIVCQESCSQTVEWGATGWRAILLRWLNWLVWWWWEAGKEEDLLCRLCWCECLPFFWQWSHLGRWLGIWT